jgi:Zn-dependent protease with chaperone function
MSSIRRLELALLLLAGSMALIALIVAVDVLRFHLPALLAGNHAAPGHHDIALAALALGDALVVWRLGPSLCRQACAQRRLRRLRVVGRREVAGHAVTVVRDRRALAFCAGPLRPALYVSDTALARLRGPELRAVIEHEAHHARRRDPLRQLAAQTAADAFGFLPPLRGLARSTAALADLAADDAAVTAVGSRAPLAAALLALEEPAPERVDHLLGRPVAPVAPGVLVVAVLAVAALLAVAVGHLVLPDHPGVPAWALPALATPALLAARAVAYR